MKQSLYIYVFLFGMNIIVGEAIGAASDITAFSGATQATSGYDGTCPLLESDTNLKTSSGVYAAFQCIEDISSILAAACAEAGSRSAPALCSSYDDDNDPGTEPIVIGDGCTLDMVDGVQTASNPSYKGFGITSAGGGMIELSLGGRCASGDVLKANDEGFWIK